MIYLTSILHNGLTSVDIKGEITLISTYNFNLKLGNVDKGTSETGPQPIFLKKTLYKHNKLQIYNIKRN